MVNYFCFHDIYYVFDFKYSDGSNHFSYATNGLAADVNQDNVIDMQDAIQIGKYVSGQSSTLVD